MILASHRIGVMRRNRRVDPKSFELTTECPDCHYASGIDAARQ